ncbi:Spo0B domain-containing protein [Paeniglutamicibacter sp. ABSL32-1]|uniref:sensor histidine kinase n=1 Tax=Paeniglutamicibacter quisquiliarum TaxID=2849498 RepID=UPI001C2CF1E3|nr:Spo0B domain-containing protein [Paeniglutamicibacter quisquiliarum]
MHSLSKNRRRAQLLALQLGIVLGLMGAVSIVVLAFEDHRTQEVAFDRVHTVAVQMAAQETVQEHLGKPRATEVIAPIANLATAVSGVRYVTVADLAGIRVAHPDPDRIGEPVSSDHDPVRAGESFRGTEDGPQGVTLRAKEPVWFDGEVVGTVSVGILQSDIRGELLDVVGTVAPWILGAAALGTIASALTARVVRRRIYGVEPEAVAGLLQSQQALLFSVHDGVVGVDTEGRLTLVNDEARRLLGLEGEVVGAKAADVLDPTVHAQLSSEAPEAEETQFVLSGERILVATRREALANGKSLGRTLTLVDRTEMEATLRELKGQRSLADALASQAHEFSNRLHVLSGYLSFGEPGEAAEYLQRISGATLGAEAGSLGDPALSGLVGANAANAREAGVRLVVDPESGTEPDWRADEDALTVVGNLLSNAIEAAGDGGQVRLLLNAGAKGLRICVEDSGPGIAPSAVEEVFRRGVSSKPGAGVQHGIGLALVDRVIRRRAGSVEVSSGDLGGAMITVEWNWLAATVLPGSEVGEIA